MRTNLANVLFLVTLTVGAGVGPALADLRLVRQDSPRLRSSQS
jgi:hypothetical protein